MRHTLLTLALTALPVFAQQSDRDLFAAVAQESDAAKKITLLAEWTERFPDSAYARERNLHYIATYSLLENAALAPNAKPAATDLGQRAATLVIQRADQLFAASLQPANVPTANWVGARGEAIRQAHSVLAALATARADHKTAEAEYHALARLVPDDAVILLRIGSSIVSQKDPERYPEAIYYLARAVAKMSPGTDRESAGQYLRRVYQARRGDLDELPEVIAQAAVRPALPPDWTVMSAAQVAKAQTDAIGEFNRTHPELALWRQLRIKLSAADGAEFFSSELRDTQLPRLKGTIASRPSPREVVLNMEGSASEVTLKLDALPKEELTTGTEVAFTGVAQAFRPDPLMLTLEVNAKDLSKP